MVLSREINSRVKNSAISLRWHLPAKAMLKRRVLSDERMQVNSSNKHHERRRQLMDLRDFGDAAVAMRTNPIRSMV